MCLFVLWFFNYLFSVKLLSISHLTEYFYLTKYVISSEYRCLLSPNYEAVFWTNHQLALSSSLFVRHESRGEAIIKFLLPTISFTSSDTNSNRTLFLVIYILLSYYANMLFLCYFFHYFYRRLSGFFISCRELKNLYCLFLPLKENLDFNRSKLNTS